MSNNTIFISGATGFTGRNLVEALIRDGHSVIIFKRPSNVLFARSGLNIQEIDVNDFENLEPFIRGSKLVTFVHLATFYRKEQNSPYLKEIYEANVELGVKILNLAAKYQAHFVHAESYLQFENALNSTYLETKREFSKIVEEHRRKASISSLVLFDSYGMDDNRKKVLSSMIEAKRNDMNFEIDNANAILIYTHIVDIVNAIRKTIINQVEGRFRINGSDKFKLLDIYNFIYSGENRTIPAKVAERVYHAEQVEPLPMFKQTQNLLDFINYALSKKSEQ